jgi:hypothetical protein
MAPPIMAAAPRTAAFWVMRGTPAVLLLELGAGTVLGAGAVPLLLAAEVVGGTAAVESVVGVVAAVPLPSAVLGPPVALGPSVAVVAAVAAPDSFSAPAVMVRGTTKSLYEVRVSAPAEVCPGLMIVSRQSAEFSAGSSLHSARAVLAGRIAVSVQARAARKG